MKFFRETLKKLTSLGVALTLMHTPVLANAEIKENEDNNETKMEQHFEDRAPMEMTEFDLGVANAYSYLTSFINYDDMANDVRCLYYLTNREYISSELEEDLIASEKVFETDFDSEKYETFLRAYNLINMVADYNQSTIREAENIGDLIDVSIFCYDDEDAKLVHDMHVNYFNAYKNGRFYKESFEDNEAYEMVFKQLTTLNAAEKAGNASELSVGARWLALNSIGGGVMQMLRDDMAERYSRKELDKYFDKGELNKRQWILRDDISLDLNRCIEKPDLESEVSDFGQLWVFVYDTVNNDLMKTFQIDCRKSK